MAIWSKDTPAVFLSSSQNFGFQVTTLPLGGFITFYVEPIYTDNNLENCELKVAKRTL